MLYEPVNFGRYFDAYRGVMRGGFNAMGGKSYWKYQVPIYGNFARARESAQYASDIQKNTGRSVKYPGLLYNNAGKNAFTEALSLTGPIGRSVKYL